MCIKGIHTQMNEKIYVHEQLSDSIITSHRSHPVPQSYTIYKYVIIIIIFYGYAKLENSPNQTCLTRFPPHPIRHNGVGFRFKPQCILIQESRHTKTRSLIITRPTPPIPPTIPHLHRNEDKERKEAALHLLHPHL